MPSTGSKKEVLFCACGLVIPCKKHFGKEIKKPKKTIGRHCGFSNFKENGDYAQ